MARTADPALQAQRRTAITDAAAAMFAEHGFDATPVTSIANAAGVSSATVFHYFGDKRGLFRSIFEQDLPKSRALAQRYRDADDPLAAILDMVTELVAPASDPAASGLAVEVIRQVGHDPALAAILHEDDAIVTAGLTHLLGRARGRIDPTLEPLATATWIRAIADSAFLYAGHPGATNPVDTLRTIVLRYLTGQREEDNP